MAIPTDRSNSSFTAGTRDEIATAPRVGVVTLLMRLIKRHPGVFVWIPGIAAAAIVAIALTLPRTYTSSAMFIPQGGNLLKGGALGGLAAQLGVSVPASDPTDSPDFYAKMVASPDMLLRMVQDTITVHANGRSRIITLVDFLDVSGDTPAERADKAVRKLDKQVDVNRDLKTGIITVSVHLKNASVAMQVAQRLVDHMDQFNQSLRQSKAAGELQFAKERFRELQAELDKAQEAVAAFNVANRSYTSSPVLMVREQQLEQTVGLRQQMYTAFAQLYEQDRLDAARNTPVVLEVSRPQLAVRADSRHLVAKIILGMLVAFVVAFVIAVFFDARSALPGTVQ